MANYGYIRNPKFNNKNGEFKFGYCPYCDSAMSYRGTPESKCLICGKSVKWAKKESKNNRTKRYTVDSSGVLIEIWDE